MSRARSEHVEARRPGWAVALGLLALLALVSAGCRGPSRANIELRREAQATQRQIQQLEAQNRQLRADIARQQQADADPDALPPDRMEYLFTTAGLTFGRLTGADRIDGRPGLRVFLRPVDDAGDRLKAAGAITIEAFDLRADEPRLGRWEFPLEQARGLWVSGGLLNEYVLPCPWPGEPPAPGTQVVIQATFVEALTGRTFEGRTDVTVR